MKNLILKVQTVLKSCCHERNGSQGCSAQNKTECNTERVLFHFNEDLFALANMKFKYEYSCYYSKII